MYEWIGLTRSGSQNVWDDGTPFTWSNWETPPAGIYICTSIHPVTYKWYERNCQGAIQDTSYPLCQETGVDPMARVMPGRPF